MLWCGSRDWGGFSPISSYAIYFLGDFGWVTQPLCASIPHLRCGIAAPSHRALGRRNLLADRKTFSRCCLLQGSRGKFSSRDNCTGRWAQREETGRSAASQGKELFLSFTVLKMNYFAPSQKPSGPTVGSPAAGTRGAPPAPSPGARGAGVFSLLGTFLHTAKINRGLLMELLFLTSVAQKCQSYRTAPRRGARSQQPWGRGAPASGNPIQELGGSFQPPQAKGDPQPRGSGPSLGMLTQPSLRKKASSEAPAASSAHRFWHAPEKSQHLHHSEVFPCQNVSPGRGRRRERQKKTHKQLFFCFATSLNFYI